MGKGVDPDRPSGPEEFCLVAPLLSVGFGQEVTISTYGTRGLLAPEQTSSWRDPFPAQSCNLRFLRSHHTKRNDRQKVTCAGRTHSLQRSPLRCLPPRSGCLYTRHH